MAPQRRLHAGHFAFMRAVVQGLDVTLSWDRYLRTEGGSDARTVRATMAWIRNEFAAAAQRHSRYGVARLVQLDTARLGAGGVMPTLEAFSLERGLEDFSEAEQIEAFEAEYRDVLRKARRRQRLIERQLEALTWLEGLNSGLSRPGAARPPRAADPVADWFDPALAGLLERAGLATLGALVERINGIGQRWYAPLRGIGITKAQRIVAWLRNHEGSLAASGARLGAHAERPRTALARQDLAAVLPPATAVRPLEKFIVPAALDGSRGLYRRPQHECLLQARNDHEAILAWLHAKRGNAGHPARSGAASGSNGQLGVLDELSHTQRAYRKEAERFLLWAVIERGKPLSSMSVEDCTAYRHFMADPQPRERWCAARARQRWSPLWRPFEKPLSVAAQRQAVRILGNLFSFLNEVGYLRGNPWAGVAVPKPTEPKLQVGRSFTSGQWAFVLAQLRALPASPRNDRLRLAVQLLYATGLRLSEAVAATMGDLQRVHYPADHEGPSAEGWMLRVLGKGAKRREVPVPLGLIQAFTAQLAAAGRDPDPLAASNAGVPLLDKLPEPRHGSSAGEEDGAIGPGRGGRQGAPRRAAVAPVGIAANTLYGLLKGFFKACAHELQTRGNARAAASFKLASTHWLRHTHANHAIGAGVPLEVTQQNLGHASLTTTTAYLTTESKRQLRAMSAFWGE